MESITLGNNLQPPVINMEKTQDIYDLVRDEEFEVDSFNSLLAAVVTYCDIHGVDFDDGALPWAEIVEDDS